MLLLDKGERGLLIGQTGSGKSQNAIFQLRNAKVWPIIIFDTKIEDAFFGVPDDSESLEVIESLSDFEKHSKLPRNKMPDFTLVRPGIDEMQDFELLDAYSGIAYHKFGPVFLYYDELYNWHNNGRAGNNMLALLTRGRSKGKTWLGSTQRPCFISRFCFTESQKFYVHLLSDVRDKKTVENGIPNYSRLGNPPKYHFYHYEVGHHDAPQLIAPVPFQELTKADIRRQKNKWL